MEAAFEEYYNETGMCWKKQERYLCRNGAMFVKLKREYFESTLRHVESSLN